MPNYELIQSVGRALDILELVGSAEAGMSRWSVIYRTHLSNSTAHNLLRTLVAKGFLVKRRNPILYYPGPALLNFRKTYRDYELFERAKPVLMHLANSLGGNARLDQCVGVCEMGMLFAYPRQAAVVQPPLPPDMLPYGIGIVFQAYWDKQQRAEHGKRFPFAKYGKRLWGNRQRLNRFLAGFKKNRVAMIPIRITGGHFRAAAPIFGRDGKVVAIICFVKPIKQTTAAFRNKCCEAVRKAGVELSFAGG